MNEEIKSILELGLINAASKKTVGELNRMENFHQKPSVYVGEVNIKVKNLDNSVTFYQNIIGFQVLEQTESKAVLTTDGKTPLLMLEQPADVIPKAGNMSGLYHFAILRPK